MLIVSQKSISEYLSVFISDISLWYVSGNKGEMQTITHNYI